MFFCILDSLKISNLLDITFKNTFLSWLIKKRLHKIELFIKYPHQSQKNVLTKLLQNAKRTEFGKEHGFKDITTYQQFREQVPIRTYEEIFSYIEKVRTGRANILWPGKANWFAKSSGTTNAQSKYIPITKESLIESHYKAGKDMICLYCHNFPETKIFNGKGIMLGGSQKKNKENTFIDGDLSAILLDNFPFWVNMHRIPDKKTALMSNWEKKIELIAEQASKNNITNLTGVPSWMLILLNKVKEKASVSDLTELWPNIELFMHGGINFSPYKEQFENLFPSNKLNYLEGYNASEGFFAIQDQKKSSELLLMLDYGIFYEFIPMNKFNNFKNAIPIWEVEKNQEYAIIISTNSGLYRYLIGDTIRFTSTSPYRIKIVGRTKSFVNCFGEELVVENAEEALLFACQKENVIVKDFTVGPIYLSKNAGCHQWLIEFIKAPQNLFEFARLLDKKLQNLNSDYKAKRSDSIMLKQLEIVILPENAFFNWLAKKNRLGGQYKVPRLSNNRTIVDEILISLN